MYNYKNKKVSKNDLLQTIQRSKTSIEEQDNESINTMDYYKEDNSSKNNKFEENIYSSNQKANHATEIKSKPKKESPQLLVNFSKPIFGNQGGLYDEITFATNTTLSKNRNKKGKNVEKRFDTIADYCSKCESEINYSTKICSNCSRPVCKKCLKEIFSRNLDNNSENIDTEILSRNINEKNCPNCGKSSKMRNFSTRISKKKSSPCQNKEHIETEPDITSSSSHNQNCEKDFVVKGLKKQSNEYNLFLKKIEEKKKEIEIKKNLNVNIIQMLQKSIEYEYNFNLDKLNHIISKIKKVQEMITDKMNKLNIQKNFNNNADLQNIVEKFKKAMGFFSKNYEKVVEKINLKSKPKAYKCYESNPLLVNLSDTYCMRSKKLLSNNHIGNAFFRVDRYVNGFVNCLNFSVSIKQDKKNNPINNNNNNNNNNSSNKPRYIVNLIVDNKIIKLNKVNKDKDNSCLDYECSIEEAQVFNTKNQSNSLNNYTKKDDFCVKLIVTELFL